MNEEKKVCFFDPIVNAYRDISVELALKFIAEAKRLEEEIKKLEK